MLEDELLQIPKSHVNIVLGDFNDQVDSEKKFRDIVGRYTAYKRTTTNRWKTDEDFSVVFVYR